MHDGDDRQHSQNNDDNCSEIKNGKISNRNNLIPNEFEMKMNAMNQLHPEKFDSQFHAKIGQGMDIKIPMHQTANGNVMMNGGPPTNIGNGGFINYGYNTFMDPSQTKIDIGHQQFIEDEINEYDDEGRHEEEVYYFPVDEIVVEPCCPNVIYRMIPWCNGNEKSPFWVVWDEQRLAGSRYNIVFQNNLY